MAKIFISEEKKQQLEKGLCSSSNLMEALSIDFTKLLKNTFPSISAPSWQSKEGFTKKMSSVAQSVYAKHGLDILEDFFKHPSDTVRGWGCYLIGLSSLNFQEALLKIKPFADDSHFGVREWAWLALRPKLVFNLKQHVRLLSPFVYHPSEYMRRFAVEITRPRGVWTAHIEDLKKEPWIGLPLLEPLKKDPSKYVQNSVANWLNDAAKSQPDWVLEVTDAWAKLSTSPYTNYIIKRARRSIKH